MAFSKTEVDKILGTDLMKELGFDALPIDQKMRIADDMGKVVMQGIWLKLLEHLNESRQADLDKLLDSGVDGDQLVAFFKSAIPNYEDIVKEEIASYKSLLMQEIKK